MDAGSTMKRKVLLAFAVLILASWHGSLRAQDAASNICQRPMVGSAVTEPRDLRSRNGVLKVDLTIQNDTGADGVPRYCYIDAQGNQAPNLRLNPGDLLILRLKNNLTDSDASASAAQYHHDHTDDANVHGDSNSDVCTAGSMSPTSTNLHFHGLSVPPVCHQDDV